MAPKGTSASRRSGRWRLRTARATTTRHAGLALQPGHAGGVLGPDLHAVDEALDRGQGHAALAERRQHVLDVAQEQGVRPDDEHPLALEGEPVRIEKVCRPVQGHRRLARARAALDDHDPGELRSG